MSPPDITHTTIVHYGPTPGWMLEKQKYSSACYVFIEAQRLLGSRIDVIADILSHLLQTAQF